MTIQLSGFLPGEKASNLPDQASDLAATFDARHRDHDDTAILIPVVGILRVESVRYPRDPDAEPTVAVRFAAIEAAHGAAAPHATAVRALWLQLRDDRIGDVPLDLDWTGSADPDQDTPVTGLVADADCLHPGGCPDQWQVRGADPADADTRARRHSGDGLTGGPHPPHPTNVTVRPTEETR